MSVTLSCTKVSTQKKPGKFKERVQKCCLFFFFCLLHPNAFPSGALLAIRLVARSTRMLRLKDWTAYLWNILSEWHQSIWCGLQFVTSLVAVWLLWRAVWNWRGLFLIFFSEILLFIKKPPIITQKQPKKPHQTHQSFGFFLLFHMNKGVNDRCSPIVMCMLHLPVLAFFRLFLYF